MLNIGYLGALYWSSRFKDNLAHFPTPSLKKKTLKNFLNFFQKKKKYIYIYIFISEKKFIFIGWMLTKREISYH